MLKIVDEKIGLLIERSANFGGSLDVILHRSCCQFEAGESVHYNWFLLVPSPLSSAKSRPARLTCH